MIKELPKTKAGHTYNKVHPDEPLPRLKLHGLRTAISYAEWKLMRALRGPSSRIDLVQCGEQHPQPPE